MVLDDSGIVTVGLDDKVDRHVVSLDEGVDRQLLDYLKRSPFSDNEIDMVLRAYKFSEKVHKGQERKTGGPFFEHPKEGGRIAIIYNPEAKILAGIYLGDTVEDTDITIDDIRLEFGGDIAYIVDIVTKKDKYGRVDEDRVKRFYYFMWEDEGIALLGGADRLHNMRTIHGLPIYRQTFKSRETIEVYVPAARKHEYIEIANESEQLANRVLTPEYILEQIKIEKQMGVEERIKKYSRNISHSKVR